MIVISRKVGRLGNRLLLFAHFIGAAVEHGFKVVNPMFHHYAKYFPSTAGDLFCRFPATDPVTSMGFVGRHLLYRATILTANALHAFQYRDCDFGVIRLRRDQSLNLDSPAFLSYLRAHRAVFVQDWFFRSSIDCEKHGDVIRSFFTPREPHLERARALVESARQKGKFVVGVHIRQGDYVFFKEGRFFYSHHQFRHLMDQIRSNFPDRPVSFLVCSDAPMPADAFAGLDVSYGSGHELEDLYALATCDLLAGPPSTYSRWASFYGKVPRYVISDPTLSPTPEQFQVASRLGFDGPAPALEEWRDPRS